MTNCFTILLNFNLRRYNTAARAFEQLMSDISGAQADQPLYAAAAHHRWYAAGGGTGGTGGGGGCRPGGPPRVCLAGRRGVPR
jgi:hypothetical protein